MTDKTDGALEQLRRYMKGLRLDHRLLAVAAVAAVALGYVLDEHLLAGHWQTAGVVALTVLMTLLRTTDRD